jgi:glutamate formiminotransferase/formiminotetrahydrofolate cyclodeaminase
MLKAWGCWWTAVPVSMNLTNYHGTPVARVVELIRREAGRYGVSIHHSELVGLIPQESLVDAAVWYLQLDQFEPEQVLEQRLAAALQAEFDKAAKEVGEGQRGTAWGATSFLEALAAGTAAPGGGSAPLTVGRPARACAMVARLTIGRSTPPLEDQMQALLERSELRGELTAAIERARSGVRGGDGGLQAP